MALIRKGRHWAILTLVVSLTACVSSKPVTPATGNASRGAGLQITYHCGEMPLAVRYNASAVDISLAGEQYTLPQVPAASGAKFEAGAGDTYRLFWTRGNDARMVIGEQVLPACVLDRPITPAAASDVLVTGRDWVVEDINGGGVIDYSHATLSFGADGQLTGEASCNHYTTRYNRSGLALNTTAIVTTRMACPEALMNQEQRMLDILANVEAFTIDDTGALILSTADGRTLQARQSR